MDSEELGKVKGDSLWDSWSKWMSLSVWAYFSLLLLISFITLVIVMIHTPRNYDIATSLMSDYKFEEAQRVVLEYQSPFDLVLITSFWSSLVFGYFTIINRKVIVGKRYLLMLFLVTVAIVMTYGYKLLMLFYYVFPN